MAALFEHIGMAWHGVNLWLYQGLNVLDLENV